MNKTLLLSLVLLTFTGFLFGQSGPMTLIINTNHEDGTTLELPLFGTVNVTVDWGDEDPLKEAITSAGWAAHTYDTEGTYTVEITGSLSHFGDPNPNEEEWKQFKMLEKVTSFGELAGTLNSLAHAFFYAQYLTEVPATLPVGITDLSHTFTYTFFESLTNLAGWDVSNVTNMSNMFSNTNSFNQDINGWNVGNVTDMSNMFHSSTVFNQNIGGWDVSAVTDMSMMFRGAFSFNGAISGWDVSAVTDMSMMFSGATAFNQNIGWDGAIGWDVSNVTDMHNMFHNAENFNGSIGGWNVGSVTDMESVFHDADAFNQDISEWDVGSVTNMLSMLNNADAFNQDIGRWDVSKVTNMNSMFLSAAAFNQDISGWVVSAVTDMSFMFADSPFNQDISGWDVSAVTDMSIMFALSPFNQNISGWDVSAVTNMSNMFWMSPAFDQNIGGWDITGVTTMEMMFNSAGLSTANYNALLIGWAAQEVQSDVLFDGGSSKYSAGTAAAARQSLITDDGWVFADTDGPATTLTWDGSESSTWGTGGNWDGDIVPTINDDVVLANTGAAPIIASATEASCNTLSINADVVLTINSGGSLITNDNISNNGTVSVKQSLTEDDHWHFISMPNSNTTANTFDGMYLQQWIEGDGAGTGWQDVTDPIAALTPAKGFSLWIDNGAKMDFSYDGTPNTGNQSLGISHTGSGTYEGMNFVGNPYPSFLDWDKIVGYGTKYTWNGTAYTTYTEEGSGDGSQYVNPMEGFFIYTADATGTFNLNNNMRAHNTDSKSVTRKPLQNGLILSASNGSYDDNLWIIFKDEASELFELERDAWKLLSGTQGLSQLWSESPDGKLAVDIRPETQTIQLGFANDLAGIYNIGISEIADISEAYLEDTKTNTFHNLTKGIYEFAWDVTDDEMRFKLHFKAVDIEENQISESDILIYAADGNIYIKNIYGSVQTGHALSVLYITDITGRTLLHQQLPDDDFITIPVNLQTGVYLVSVISGNKIITEKIFIQ